MEKEGEGRGRRFDNNPGIPPSLDTDIPRQSLICPTILPNCEIALRLRDEEYAGM